MRYGRFDNLLKHLKLFKGLKDIFKETLKEILKKFKENGFINLLIKEKETGGSEQVA
jgi:hypothetical protein